MAPKGLMEPTVGENVILAQLYQLSYTRKTYRPQFDPDLDQIEPLPGFTLEESIRKLDEELDTLRPLRKLLNFEKSRATQGLRKCERKLLRDRINMNDEIDRLSGDLYYEKNLAREKLEELSGELGNSESQLQLRIQQSEKISDTFQAELHQLTAQNETLRADCAFELDVLDFENRKLSDALERAEQETSTFSTRVTAVERTKKNLSDENTRLNATNTNLKLDIKSLKAKKSTLETNLETCQRLLLIEQNKNAALRKCMSIRVNALVEDCIHQREQQTEEILSLKLEAQSASTRLVKDLNENFNASMKIEEAASASALEAARRQANLTLREALNSQKDIHNEELSKLKLQSRDKMKEQETAHKGQIARLQREMDDAKSKLGRRVQEDSSKLTKTHKEEVGNLLKLLQDESTKLTEQNTGHKAEVENLHKLIKDESSKLIETKTAYDRKLTTLQGDIDRFRLQCREQSAKIERLEENLKVWRRVDVQKDDQLQDLTERLELATEVVQNLWDAQNYFVSEVQTELGVAVISANETEHDWTMVTSGHWQEMVMARLGSVKTKVHALLQCEHDKQETSTIFTKFKDAVQARDAKLEAFGQKLKQQHDIQHKLRDTLEIMQKVLESTEQKLALAQERLSQVIAAGNAKFTEMGAT